MSRYPTPCQMCGHPCERHNAATKRAELAPFLHGLGIKVMPPRWPMCARCFRGFVALETERLESQNYDD